MRNDYIKARKSNQAADTPRFPSGTETVSKPVTGEATVALVARESLCTLKTQGTNSNLILGAILPN